MWYPQSVTVNGVVWERKEFVQFVTDLNRAGLEDRLDNLAYDGYNGPAIVAPEDAVRTTVTPEVEVTLVVLPAPVKRFGPGMSIIYPGKL